MKFLKQNRFIDLASLTPGMRVKLLMTANKIKQKHLAAKLDFSSPILNRCLNGDLSFTENDLARIAAFLGVPLGVLYEPRKDQLGVSRY